MEKQSPGFFVTPFSAAYWRAALSEFKNLKVLVLTALFIALRVAINGFKIPLADNMNLFFVFIPTAVCAFVCGPVVGLFAGAISDSLSFFISPIGGAYHFGFMLCEMLEYFLFALLLYRTKVSIFRIFLAMFAVDAFVNVYLTAIWLNDMYGNGFMVILIPRIIKHAIFLIPEVIVLGALFTALLPAMKKMRVVPVASEKVSFF